VHLRVAWRTLVLGGTPDQQILPTLARLLQAETQGHAGFVTACDVTIDPGRAQVTLRVAGHPAPLRCAKGKTMYLDVEVGRPLGVEPPGADEATTRLAVDGWPDSVASLDPGSSLVLYTDGLLDAYVSASDEASLGIDELVGAISNCAVDGAAARAWIPTIVGDAPSQSVDDTAVVVITTAAPEE
jgi:serine phosphatase RsbU (regulator of sigma subunit)